MKWNGHRAEQTELTDMATLAQRCKKRFFTFFNSFHFPYDFKNKNVEKLLSMQANSEITFSYATFLNSKLVKLCDCIFRIKIRIDNRKKTS